MELPTLSDISVLMAPAFFDVSTSELYAYRGETESTGDFPQKGRIDSAIKIHAKKDSFCFIITIPIIWRFNRALICMKQVIVDGICSYLGKRVKYTITIYKIPT